jgi:hypothetical protein
LQQAAFGSAYFTKNKCWSYESERRLLVKDNDVRKMKDRMILFIPTKCITAIIVGPQAEEKLRNRCRKICKSISCEYFEMKIGKSSIMPFFINAKKKTFLFNGHILAEAQNYCGHCGEPIENKGVDECSWCTIDEALQIEATQKNPLRMLDRFGLLEEYIKGFEEIEKKYKKGFKKKSLNLVLYAEDEKQ